MSAIRGGQKYPLRQFRVSCDVVTDKTLCTVSTQVLASNAMTAIALFFSANDLIRPQDITNFTVNRVSA